MQAAAHTKGGFGGVPQKVGKEFVSADKRLPSSKAKKMADGGIAGLGGMIANGPSTPPTPASSPKSSFSGNGSTGGGGNSLSAGLDAISSGAQNASAALDRARTDLGSGGSVSGASSPIAAKKGGHITTRRVSSVSRSKKSPSW
jgi:hypothetical protein